MSSRQQEKEARRRAREDLERAEAAAAARKKRLGLVAGVALGLAAIVAVAVAIAAGGGASKGPGPKASATSVPDVKPPAQKTSSLPAAAAAAKCTVSNPPSEGRTHVTTAVKYRTNPPTSGNHNPTPAQDGIYPPGQTPAAENLVHTLEHGRIEIQYRPGISRRIIGQLQGVAAERKGYHVLVFENQTKMPYDVAVTAWTHLLACPKASDAMFDAIRAFRVRYTDTAPEFYP
jgi:hypothetical protein